MPIPVACACGAKFAAKDELAGKRVKCPKCSQPLTIPAAGAAAAGASAAAAGAPAAARTAAAKPSDAGDPIIAALLDEVGLTASKTGVRCPNCRADVKPDDVMCVQCGYNIETGKKAKTRVEANTKAGH